MTACSYFGFCQPTIVKDINQLPTSSSIAGGVEFNGLHYFVANNTLWETDGTTDGTKISAAAEGLSIMGGANSVVLVGGKLIFVAITVEFGSELMVTDGVNKATLLKDIVPGEQGASILLFSQNTCSDKYYFIQQLSGQKLWVTDGTLEGTNQLMTFSSTSFSEYSCLDGKILFRGTVSGVSSLWTSDGTVPGTVPIETLCCATGFTNFDGFTYFINSNQLWKTNGLEFGTTQVSTAGLDNFSIPTSPSPYLAVHDNKLYFAGKDDAHGTELWFYDGINFQLAEDIVPGNDSSFPRKFVSTGSKMFFIADGLSTGAELFAYDNFTNTVGLVKDIYPGPEGSSSSFELVQKFGENVFYAGTNGTNGREWWISDGTEAGTNILKDINVGAGNGIVSTVVTRFSGKLLFPADDGQNGIELHVSDGTENGTMLLKDLAPGTSSSQISRLFTPLGKLFFMANDGFGSDLWTTDGTGDGTKLIKEIGPILSSDITRGMYVIGSKFIFTPLSANGIELWISDGTEENTMEIIDLNPGIASGTFASPLGQTDDMVFFRGNDGTGNGVEIWRTDGTAAGTILLKDINPGAGSSNPHTFTNINGEIIFFATDLVGQGMWKSNGTPDGTLKVTPLPSGLFVPMTFLNNDYYFAISQNNVGISIFKTNGTSGGTIEVKRVEGSGSFGLFNPLALLDKMAFFLDDGITGRELWVTDGSEQGTILVKDINPGLTSSVASNDITNAVIQNKIYFAANDGVVGKELWVSDGTTEGTLLAFDLIQGSESSNPSFLRAINENLFFGANNMNGSKMYFWNSSLQLPEFFDVSNPSNFTLVDNTVYFLANSELFGRELWKYNLPVEEEEVEEEIDDIPPVITSVNKPQNETTEIKLYPNPFLTQINVEVPDSGKIRVRDLLGRTLKEVQVVRGSVIFNELSNLTAGIYVFEFTSEHIHQQMRVVKR